LIFARSFGRQPRYLTVANKGGENTHGSSADIDVRSEVLNLRKDRHREVAGKRRPSRTAGRLKKHAYFGVARVFDQSRQPELSQNILYPLFFSNPDLSASAERQSRFGRDDILITGTTRNLLRTFFVDACE
jgi:hypothetical protein